MNIVLIGMRGVGKTNIARRLSFRTKRPVMSTDILVEYETGMSVPEYVQGHGWPTFRDRELEVVRKVTALDGLIIDAGGGVVVDLDDEGREVYSHRKVGLLRDNGYVVFLRGDVDRLAAKVQDDPNRPTLNASRSAAELMRARMPFYEAAAQWIIDVEGRQRANIAEEIAERFPL